MTLRAIRLVQTADLVAWDRLTPRQALDLARPDAELICVGKRKGRPSWAQDDINQVLVSAARAGRAVVRLKGGDPFVFGRGGEEAVACAEAGVPVEVVSGVTSAIASATAAGVPVTHRGLSASVTFVSGHEDPAKPESLLDWDGLAATRGTLVFLMGATRVGHISGMLLRHGADPDLPAMLVRWATTERQQTVVSTLADIADDVHRHDVRPPATLVIGNVVSLARLVTPRRPRPEDPASGTRRGTRHARS